MLPFNFLVNLRIKNFQTVVTNHGATRELISDANKNPSITSATIATTTRPATNSNMLIVSAVYSNYMMFACRITSGAKYWSISCPNIDN